MVILEFTCPCGNVFICRKARPDESRGVCARCREPISEATETAAIVRVCEHARVEVRELRDDVTEERCMDCGAVRENIAL